MGLQTHLGPQLLGTIKNNNPAIVLTNTPSPTYLGSYPTNGYRNLGAGDGSQFAPISFTQMNTSANNSSAVFYPYLTTNGGTAQPIVIPSGSFISSIYFDVVIPFNFSTIPTGITMNINAYGGTGTTISTGVSTVTTTCTSATTSATQAFTSTAGIYPGMVVTGAGITGTITVSSITNATTLVLSASITSTATAYTFTASSVSLSSGLNIVTHGSSSAITAYNSAQRNQVGSGTSFTYVSGTSITNIAGMQYLTNTGPTDTMLGVTFTYTGSGTAVAGSAILSVNYVLRNPDGTYYPQTPTSPIANPPAVTY